MKLRERAEALVQAETVHIAGRRPKGKIARMNVTVRLDPELVIALLEEGATISDTLNRIARQHLSDAA